MITITIKKHKQDERWHVVVAGLDIHFDREKDARIYAPQLQSRIFAPHRLPQEQLTNQSLNWQP